MAETVAAGYARPNAPPRRNPQAARAAVRHPASRAAGPDLLAPSRRIAIGAPLPPRPRPPPRGSQDRLSDQLCDVLSVLNSYSRKE